MVYNNWRFFKEQKCLILYNVSFSGAFLILVDLRSSCLLACGCLLVCRCGWLIWFGCGWLISFSCGWLISISCGWLICCCLLISCCLWFFLYNVVNSVANKQGYSEKFDSFSEKALKEKKLYIHSMFREFCLIKENVVCWAWATIVMGNNCYTFCTRSFFFGNRYNLWL